MISCSSATLPSLVVTVAVAEVVVEGCSVVVLVQMSADSVVLSRCVLTLFDAIEEEDDDEDDDEEEEEEEEEDEEEEGREVPVAAAVLLEDDDVAVDDEDDDVVFCGLGTVTYMNRRGEEGKC